VGKWIAGHFLFSHAVQETGLLEQVVLHLLAPDAAGRRNLLGPSGEPVGFARWQRRGPWWLPWKRRVLSIHEHDDQPLLFTVRRSLSLTPAFQVHDADDEQVGTLSFPWLLDRWGRPMAEYATLSQSGGVFRTLEGDVLADWMPAGSAVRLGLHQPAWADPFLKMLLLAAALHAPLPAADGD
jgi:hypothetical protein